MTRVVVIGDIHFQGTHKRNEERVRSVEQIVSEGLTLEDLGAWVVLGDVFHTRSSADDRNLVAGFLQRMASRAPTVVIFGNHDGSQELQLFSKLSATWPIHVVSAPQIVRLVTPTQQRVSIFAIPYPHKSQMVALGVQHQHLGDVASGALDVLCIKGAAELVAARQSGDMTMLIGHATLTGSVTSVGQPMGLDGDIAVDAGMLGRFGDIPKLFGHIHLPQDLLGAHYAGSVAATDAGETERKRYLVVEYEEDGTHRVLSRPLDTMPIFHVEGELTKEGFAWQVRKGPGGPEDEAPASWAGSEVRVRFRFLAAEKSALDEALVRAPFAGARRLELDPIAVRERAARAPEVAAATTLEAKVEAFVRRSGLGWTQGLETKLAALQNQPDGAAFLTDVQRGVSGPTQPTVGGDSSAERGGAGVDVGPDIQPEPEKAEVPL